MSYPATQWAWKQPVKTAADRLVLLCLADHLNHGDKRLFPSVEKMAERTRLGERTVSRSLKNLTALGCVQIVTRGGPGRSNTYRLSMSSPATQAGVQPHHPPHSPNHLPPSHDHPPHSPNHLPVWRTNQEVTGNEPRSNLEAGTADLKDCRIGSPEVLAEARRRRPDLDAATIAASKARFIERYGDSPANLPKFLDWIDGTRGAGGVSPAAKRKADLLQMHRDGLTRLQRRDDESEDEFVDRLDDWNERRKARLR